MQLGGALKIRLTVAGRRLTDVRIESPRRIDACRVLEDHSPAEASRRAAAMFSICGQAHGIASRLATEAAGAPHPTTQTAGVTTRTRDTLALLAEASQDALRRLFVDLPVALGESPRIDLLAPTLRQLTSLWRQERPCWSTLATTLEQLLTRHVHGTSPAIWAATMADSWSAWLASGATEVACWLEALAKADARPPTPPVPLLASDEIEAVVTSIDRSLAQDGYFAARPTFGDHPLESGPLARQREEPLIAQLLQAGAGLAQTRLAAWMVELAQTPQLMRRLSGAGTVDNPLPLRWTGAMRSPGGPGDWGMGWVETARGLLVHRVELANGMIRRYQIVAPTEWNLHPDGSLARALRSLDATDPQQLVRQAGLLTLAVDPCLEYKVELTGATVRADG